MDKARRGQKRASRNLFYANNKDIVCKRRKDYLLKNPIYNLYSKAKLRAKTKGLEFSITKNDILIPDFCPVLGIKLEAYIGNHRDSKMTLDRIDNSKGYTPDNIKVISWRANRLKSDASIDELKAIVAYMENNTK